MTKKIKELIEKKNTHGRWLTLTHDPKIQISESPVNRVERLVFMIINMYMHSHTKLNPVGWDGALNEQQGL